MICFEICVIFTVKLVEYKALCIAVLYRSKKKLQTEKRGAKVMKTKRLLETGKTPHPTYKDD